MVMKWREAEAVKSVMEPGEAAGVKTESAVEPAAEAAGEVPAGEAAPAEMAPAEVAPAEVAPAEVASAEVASAGMAEARVHRAGGAHHTEGGQESCAENAADDAS
jgi:hypothetical protein